MNYWQTRNPEDSKASFLSGRFSVVQGWNAEASAARTSNSGVYLLRLRNLSPLPPDELYLEVL